MVEEAHAGEGHRHAVAVAGLDDEVITDRAAGLCDVGNAALVCALDVVAEGKVVLFKETYEKEKFKLNKGVGALINGFYKIDAKGISFIANSLELLKEN